MYKKWSPSKKAKREFAEKMKEIYDFCAEHGIYASRTNDSYYFTINGVNYRVSNHSVETSNKAAYDEVSGAKQRPLYHDDGRKDDTVYIHAGKTRIIEIYNDLEAGFKLDGKGNRKR